MAALLTMPALAEDFEGPWGHGTPDHLPPPAEDVCDGEEGRAKGLCTAYCEAMDCDDPNTVANPAACEAVASKYTDATGRDMPCEIQTCPCAEYPAWAVVQDPPSPLYQENCIEDDPPIEQINYTWIESGTRFSDFGAQTAYLRPETNEFYCGYAVRENGVTDFLVLPITEGQAQACYDDIKAFTDSRGLTCV